jgi:hypothetical protein
VPGVSFETSKDFMSLLFNSDFRIIYPSALIITKQALVIFSDSLIFTNSSHGFGKTSIVLNCELLAPAGSSPADVQGIPI